MNEYGYGQGYGYGAAVAVIIIIIIIIIIVAVFAGLNNGGHGFTTVARRDEDSVSVSRADLRALCGHL